MATRPVKVSGPDARGVVIVTWETLTTTNTDGAPALVPGYPDKCVQGVGNFSGSASVALQGSNDGTNWFACSDQAGTDIAMTAATIGAVVAENPLYVRPLLSSGDGSADVDVILVCAPRNR